MRPHGRDRAAIWVATGQRQGMGSNGRPHAVCERQHQPRLGLLTDIQIHAFLRACRLPQRVVLAAAVEATDRHQEQQARLLRQNFVCIGLSRLQVAGPPHVPSFGVDAMGFGGGRMRPSHSSGLDPKRRDNYRCWRPSSARRRTTMLSSTPMAMSSTRSSRVGRMRL